MRKELDIARERIKKLRAAIDRHRYLYHVLDRQEISDEALDSLKHELFRIEEKYPVILSNNKKAGVFNTPAFYL